MAQKKINYLARTFDDYKSELIKFSNEYYPEMTEDFNDASVGAWFIDLVSAVGDDLSYYIDKVYQETNINSLTTRSAALNLARSNGLKVPGPKGGLCEVELSCILPVDPTNIAAPDWTYSPLVRKTSIVSAGAYKFELTEDVNFGEQFNKDGYSNRKFIPMRDENAGITAYTVYKSTVVSAGSTKIYKKIITESELEPFMEVVLPDLNIVGVDSILFKETADFSIDPQVSEFFYDDEEFRMKGEAINTFRFFEVNSLADQYRFGTISSRSVEEDDVVEDKYNPEVYEDVTETVVSEGAEASATTLQSQKTTRYYRGKWKPITQKFITEYTDNGYLKIIFGSGVAYDELPSGQTTYADYRMSKIINNDMLGVLPRAGWTMYVLYTVGGGVETNVPQGSVNSVSLLNVEWPFNAKLDSAVKGQILNSFNVQNSSTSIGGKDAPTTEEIKALIKYNTSSQNRCVTLKDYKGRLMMMPPKYGAPFRANVIEENNKIVMALLGLSSDGKLDSSLPKVLVDNIIEYMSHFKSLNDYIEIKSGKIYHLGFLADVFIDKNYNTSDVVRSVISTIEAYFAVADHDMGDDIFLGDLEKELNLIDGVISLIDLRVYNIYGGSSYSPDKCPLPERLTGDSCNSVSTMVYNIPDDAKCFEVDLDAIDHVLYGDYNAMYEIYDVNDIQVRAKLK